MVGFGSGDRTRGKDFHLQVSWSLVIMLLFRLGGRGGRGEGQEGKMKVMSIGREVIRRREHV